MVGAYEFCTDSLSNEIDSRSKQNFGTYSEGRIVADQDVMRHREPPLRPMRTLTM